MIDTKIDPVQRELVKNALIGICDTMLVTIVRTARPVSSQPAKGVFFPFERNDRGSTRKRRSRSRRVTSAREPGASVPPSTFKIRAGPEESSSTIRGSVRMPGRTSRSRQIETAVSSPTIPKGAESKSSSFSSWWWGAWSVAMASTAPSLRPSRSACRSSSVVSGGFILAWVS